MRAGGAERGAGFGGAIERLDGGGQRFGTVGLHQHGMWRHFWNCRRAGGDDGLGGRHGLEQHDAEAFLDAGQAEEIRAVVLGQELGTRNVAQPHYRAVELQLARKAMQRGGARAVADDPYFEAGDASGERGGRVQQHVHALAPVQPADQQHGKPRGIGRVELREASPLAEIDQLRHDGRELAQAVELPRAFAGVVARHQDAGRALHVQPLAARLHRHGEARQPGFEAGFVGNDPLQRGDVRRAARDPIAIHIEADGEIEIRGRTKPPVEPEALQGVHGQPDARSRELDGVAQAFERLCQDVNPDVGAAAALNIERRGSEESDSHLGYAQDYDIRLWGA